MVEMLKSAVSYDRKDSCIVNSAYCRVEDYCD